MNKKIVYIKEDGKLGIITPNESTKLEDESWKKFYERIKEKDVPLGCRATIIDKSDLPEGKEFRDLWDVDVYDCGGSIKFRDKVINAN
jgi:hypothetical protein